MEEYQGFERRSLDNEHIKARKTQFKFPKDIPKYWLGGNAVRTHLVNSMNMFFPPFERMIMRVSIKSTMPLLNDEHLIAQLQGFIAQEETHAQAHASFIDNIEAQGYKISRYNRFLGWFFSNFLEKTVSHIYSISIVAGFEHYTDILAGLILKQDFLDDCEPRMKELLQWHAAEEVEHSQVPFDVLQAIDNRYWVRMVGNVGGLSLMLGFVLFGTCFLLYQDKRLFKIDTFKNFGELFFTKYKLTQEITKLFFEYSRRDFNKVSKDHYNDLASEILEPNQKIFSGELAPNKASS